ncbi:MAG: hypothetical protein IJS51_07175 [Treponema sp.]|nr:hypothetical protein [Treponema sp.]
MKFKARHIKIGICIFIFLVLLAVSNRLLLPIYNKVGFQIQETMQSVQNGLREKTGLAISYKSLSPSILSGVNLNGITLYDSKSGEAVASIGRLSLGYTLKSLFSKNVAGSFESLVLRDVEITIERGKNDFWLSVLNQGRNGGRPGLEAANLDGDFVKSFFESLELEGVNLKLSSDAKIYRLRIIYKDKKNDVFCESDISKAFLSANGSNKIDALVSGSFSVNLFGKKVSGVLDFSSVIPRSLDGSSAVLRFSDLNASGYRVRYVGFLAEYKDRKFTFKMLPSVRNVYAETSVDFESGNIVASLFSDSFNLGNLAQTSRDDKITESLFSMNFSLNAAASYNYKTGVFDYSSTGDIFVPGSVIPAEKFQSDTLVSYSFSGNEKAIDVSYLKTSGERYNLNFEGACDFTTKQPSGTLAVESVILPNGGEISTEIYIDKLENGFMCFAPQIFLDQNVFTAAQLNVLPSADSWDWTFEVSDYSHESEPGTVSIFGSWSPQTKAAQASLSFNTIYLDSIVKTSAFFAEENMKPLLNAGSEAVQSFIFSCDTFASGVGQDFSFSVPYAIVANTSRDDQMLILEADGNEDTFQLSRLEFVFGGQKLLMDGLVERFPESKERLLSGRLELNGIPYNFSGVSSKDRLEINSEYGLRFAFGTDTSGAEAVIEGAFAAAGFPIRVSDRTFEISTETTFSYSLENGFSASVPYFDSRFLEGTSDLNPTLSFSASVDKTAARFDSISYSDIVSTLNGSGAVVYNFDGRILQNADYNFLLENSFGFEKVSLNGTIINSLQTPLNVGSILSGSFVKNLFFTLQLNIDSLRSERFYAGSSESDSVNANVTMQGSVSNPFVALDIPRAALTVQNKPLTFSAQAVIEDRVFSLQKASADWGDTEITGILANFDQKTWDGNLSFNIKTNFFGRVLNAKAGAVIKAESPVDKGVPEAFSVSLDAEEIKAVQKGKKKPEKFHVGIMKIQDDFFLSSSPNIGVNGSLVGYRDVSVSVKNDAPFNLNVDGSVGRNFLDLKVSDIQISPRVVLDSLGIDLVKIYKGLAVGGFELKGSPMNPSFHGQIDIPNAEFNFPNFFKKRASTPMVSLIMSGSQFYTEPTRCHLQGQPIDVTVNVQMNRLAFESLDVRVQTIGNEYVPLNLNLSEMHVKGDFLADMTISLENDTIGVSGELTAKNANAEFGATRLNEIVSGLKLSDSDDDDDDGFPVDVSLRIKTGPRVQISYTTFLRAVVVPGSEIEVTYVGEDKRLLLDGEVPIRSGEIVYLNSSFYIKEGEIHFSDDDESFDPSISIVAECKTRDEDSEPVTITLSVEKQHLSNLKPRLSASPAKSEREIMEILGGIITANADSAAAFALATGDYAIQTVVIRRLENALRDFFNFDIFSVRTMVVQNAVKQSVRNSSGSGNLAGNYLDGTTVYIGKYFGDTLFADAMLRLDYDKNRVNNDYAYDGIAFKPEVGFELAAPFAKIRWSVSPDLESILNMKIVENTALTLSWKFNF